MTLIREPIQIPTEVSDGDFVLKLTQGVDASHAEQTVRDYEVTSQLAGAFDTALALISSAVESGDSKAAFLDSSFGGGKSHFMAILHLLLQADPNARGLAGLAPVLANRGPKLEGKRFLLVPVHFLGAHSMEQKILIDSSIWPSGRSTSGSGIGRIGVRSSSGRCSPGALIGFSVGEEGLDLDDGFGELDGFDDVGEVAGGAVVVGPGDGRLAGPRFGASGNAGVTEQQVTGVGRLGLEPSTLGLKAPDGWSRAASSVLGRAA
jgi:hypothetical protein